MPKDEDRIFDVSKPQRTSPSPTSRPIIVGHHPMMSDPMVHGDAPMPPLSPEHRAIPVHDGDNSFPAPTPLESEPAAPPVVAEHPESVAAAAPPPPPNPDAPTAADTAAADAPTGDLHLASLDDVIGHDGPHHHHPHPAKPDTPDQPKKKSGKMGLWILLVLLILVGGYLGVDAATNVNLPFQVFKKAAPAAPAVTTTQTKSSTASALPAGFTVYKLTGTTLSFDYPTAWGAPTVTADPGFSSRSATAKSDGTYAYLVNFATNKDIQIAATSSKYLPASRGALYYDYLQWCTGSNDDKFYKSLMHFTTANKVDTPSTVTCDQGPLTDATKLNDFTIVQLKTTDSDGSALGDLYTVNLKETDLPVLRVKDATSKNAVDIKKVLPTIKSETSQAADSTTGSASTAQ